MTTASTDRPHPSELRRLGPKGVFRVVAAIATAQIVVGGALLYASPHYPMWRMAAAAALGLATLPLAYAATRVADRNKPPWVQLAAPVTTTLLFGGMMAVVEGPTSPMSPLLLHAVVGQAARRGFDIATRTTLATAVALLVTLSIAPERWFGPDVAPPFDAWLWTVMLGGVLVSLAVEVSAMRRAQADAGRQLDSMREAILHDHAARARGLETIGAKVAHELKNPLTSIKALLQMMGEDASSESARRRHEVLEGEVARMQSILHDYLSFSRPLDELRTSELDLQSLAEHVAAVLEARARDAGVAVSVTGERVTVTGDEERLRAALLNVVGNALEATPRRGEVTITTQPADSGGATIVVRDTGRGMSQRLLDKLGTPFFSTKSEGTGLGVVIATSTVRQHGGDLSYESREGEGTTATIALPREALPAGDPSRSYEKVAHPHR